MRIAPNGRIADRLGPFVAESKKVWGWRYDEEAKELMHLHEEGMDVYIHSAMPRYGRMSNRWSRSRVNQPLVERGEVCTTRYVAAGFLAIVSHAPAAPVVEPPSCFHEVLHEWECT